MTPIGTRAIELVRRAGVAHRVHARFVLARLTAAIVASIARDY